MAWKNASTVPRLMSDLEGVIGDDAENYADTGDSSTLAAALLNTGGGLDVYQAHGSVGSSETVDLALGNEHRLTLDSASCTLTLTGATSGKVCTLVLALTQDATGGRDVVWPGSIVWANNIAPYLLTTPASGTDYIVLTTYDGGTTWYGSHSTTINAESDIWVRSGLVEPWPMDQNTNTNLQVWFASGRTHFTLWRSPKTVTVTKFSLPCGGTIAGTPTTIRTGLYSVPESLTGNLTLLANSKNVASAQTDTTEYSTTNVPTTNVAALRTVNLEYTLPFDTGSLAAVGSVGLIAGKLYATGIAWAGTTQPGMWAKSGMPGGMNLHYNMPRSLAATSLADLTTTVAISGLTQHGYAVYCAYIP